MYRVAYALGALLIVALLGLGWAWQSVVWYPAVVNIEPSCEREAPSWPADRPLKVLSFNVQYMASKNYVFFYDVEGGPDTQPSLAHTEWTLDRVAAIIRDEDPDVVLLQEINDAGDSRTHYVDQVAALQQRLAERAFACQAGAWYWQAGFILHPKVMGSVSMKLVTLSKYPIAEARRHQLPLMENDALTKRFYFQRAILETQLQSDDGRRVALLNTHFDAWGEGSSLMPQQVATTLALTMSLERAHIPWLLGGDLNLLPPDGGRQYARLQGRGAGDYDRKTALQPLYERYRAIPALADLVGNDASAWYTHFPNNPLVQDVDRTIDYLFYSAQWQLQAAYVRQHDTLDISDHLPVVGVLRLGH